MLCRLPARYEIFRDAYSSVSGLCRTVRGPSMSATPGKVCVDGVTEIAGQRVFVLHMIQSRDPSLVGRPFFAGYDPDAVWLSDLRPAFADRFPFEDGPTMCGVARRDWDAELLVARLTESLSRPRWRSAR